MTHVLRFVGGLVGSLAAVLMLILWYFQILPSVIKSHGKQMGLRRAV